MPCCVHDIASGNGFPPDVEPMVSDIEPMVSDVEPMVSDVEAMVPGVEPMISDVEAMVSCTMASNTRVWKGSMTSLTGN